MITYLRGNIKIIHLPDGEAPRWVREQSVGLILPVAGLTTDPSIGVKTKKLSDATESRYMVSQRDFLAALRWKSRIAAEWYKDHGFPQNADATFGFKIEHCQIIGSLINRQPRVIQFVGLLEVGVGAHDHPANQRENQW